MLVDIIVLLASVQRHDIQLGKYGLATLQETLYETLNPQTLENSVLEPPKPPNPKEGHTKL